ncbi:hypothetical protein PUNSTDRAFT_107745 [Punctularia strigosozonata HHB-11173 SS5]|uniref:Cytoplasmic tRNA 2-thiolation protein 2 n=1 Tax=Punctularia strigosozonata (strain HHB-11173) TaxID=741275 RepID=R7S4Z3_PUNST|nr:uncharacterized protein PUNSTDRAFT_107745 [Punctularia strigosozonata HHB-11173 SS5]EIN04897.1 hypothetical protein PUNSTDRAFT_107745 [Punctularia strigosozonata HHB-11173 SS5]
MTDCGNPAAEQDALMTRKRKYDKAKICVKCKSKPGNAVFRHAVYCKDCFVPHVWYKFGKALEPYINPGPHGPRKKSLNPTGNLCIGYSGGMGSTVLLDLVHRCYFAGRDAADDAEGEIGADGGARHPRHGRVWKHATVCFVDTGAAYGVAPDFQPQIKSVLSAYPEFEFIPISLEDAFDPAWWNSVHGDIPHNDLGIDINDEALPCVPTSSGSPRDRLNVFLNSMPTPTARMAMVSTLVRILLLYTAHSRGSSHLLLGNSSTSLSIGLISGIAQGGGFAINAELYEEWEPSEIVAKPQDSSVNVEGEHVAGAGHRRKARATWTGSVRMVRPLSDISMKECGMYSWWRNLNVLISDDIPMGRFVHEGSNVNKSIGGLTRDFIIGLERDYPSTVSTIARTCGKLAPKTQPGTLYRCCICERLSPPTVQDWKARISIRDLSNGKRSSRSSVHPAPGHSTPGNASISLADHVCYACHTACTSKSSKSGLSTAGAAAIHLPLWTRCHVDAMLRGCTTAPVKAAEALGDREEHREVWENKLMEREDMHALVQAFLLPEE